VDRRNHGTGTLTAASGNDEGCSCALEGGCACGAIRYRLGSAPIDAGYCRCRICQSTAGAPILAFATVRRSDLLIEAGNRVRRRSSDIGERWFCADCGTPLAMAVDHQPDTIDFTIPTLDDPAGVPPGYHIWTQHRIGWFDTADRLPPHERFRPHTVGLTPAIAAGGSARPAARTYYNP
jgi:hypothetical protein